MNICIVAGGEGTRFRQLSCFPKVLFPSLKNDAVLKEQMGYFGDGDSIFLIINQRFYDMVDNYVAVNSVKGLTVIPTDNHNGSYNTIRSVRNLLPDSDMLFIWSDLLIESMKFPEFRKDKNVIFTSPNNAYRYRYTSGGDIVKVEGQYNGNIPGIYYIKDCAEFFSPEIPGENIGMADVLAERCANNPDEYTGIQVDGLYEFKDLDTYRGLIAKTDRITSATRFFNRMDVRDESRVLVKTAVDPAYYHLIQKENKWYGLLSDLNIEGITPEIYGYDDDKHSLSMEYLAEYKTLHTILEDDAVGQETIRKIYARINENIHALQQYKKKVSAETFREDLFREIVTKTVARCEGIKHMLINYGKEKLEELLYKTYNYLIQYGPINGEYVLAHGDLNGSNIMVNPETLDVKFIDPRGYFGNTLNFSWEHYEYAKLLYCLYGYDDFNLNKKVYGFDLPEKTKYADMIDYLQMPIYKVLVGVIYVALAGYISQDIMKVNISYDYGISLIKEHIGK